MTPRKGHGLLIEALARNAARPWRLTIIGSLTRDPETVAGVRAAIARHGLGDRVTLAGEWEQERLGAAYEAADIFVLASYHEGYGMAFAEALAYGLPIVATTGGAIPETVPQGAGLLVPPGDVASLADALARVDGRWRAAHSARGGRGGGRAIVAELGRGGRALDRKRRGAARVKNFAADWLAPRLAWPRAPDFRRATRPPG